MSLEIPSPDLIDNEQLVPILAGECYKKGLLDIKEGRVEYFPPLMDCDFMSTIYKVKEYETTCEIGVDAINLGYNAAKIWNDNFLVSIDDLSKKLDSFLYITDDTSMFSRFKSTPKKIIVKNYSQSAPKCANDISKLLDTSLKKYTASVSEYNEAWEKDYFQFKEAMISLYLIGMTLFITTNNINAKEKVTAFYNQTHYKYDEKIKEYVKEKFDKEHDVRKNLGINRVVRDTQVNGLKQDIAEKLLVEMKKKETELMLGTDFPIEYMRWCFWTGLFYETMHSSRNEYEYLFNSVSSEGLINIENHTIGEYRKHLDEEAIESLKRISYECTYNAITFGGYKGGGIEMSVMELLDCGKALFGAGVYVGAYITHDWDTTRR